AQENVNVVTLEARSVVANVPADAVGSATAFRFSAALVRHAPVGVAPDHPGGSLTANGVGPEPAGALSMATTVHDDPDWKALALTPAGTRVAPWRAAPPG